MQGLEGADNSSINIAYGYIVGVLSTEEEPRYLALVHREFSTAHPGAESILIPIEETHEHLAATYGTPNDIVGLRVRMEYVGTDPRRGVARIVPGRNVPARPNITELPARGFRYAVAGGVGDSE